MLNKDGSQETGAFCRGRVILSLVSMERDAQTEARQAGLCAGCIHCRTVESSKDSVFYLCELSRTNPNYPKYPRLPVLSCPGYTPKTNPQTKQGM